MLVAHYIGDHKKDTQLVQLGWYLTRISQKGANKNVTHCEAILDIDPDGSCTIASASARDGGVRIKHNVRLTKGNWLITDVPFFDADKARRYFRENDGLPYDWRGAAATVLPGTSTHGHKFCTQAVGESAGLREARTFGPAHLASICLTFGADVTARFFEGYAG